MCILTDTEVGILGAESNWNHNTFEENGMLSHFLILLGLLRIKYLSVAHLAFPGVCKFSALFLKL